MAPIFEWTYCNFFLGLVTVSKKKKKKKKNSLDFSTLSVTLLALSQFHTF